jgi:hypothetical protein
LRDILEGARGDDLVGVECCVGTVHGLVSENESIPYQLYTQEYDGAPLIPTLIFKIHMPGLTS